jgi:hypothetical protein
MEMKLKLKKHLAQFAVVASSALVASSAMAADPATGTGPDLSPLTNSISFGTTITAVLAIAGSLALLYMAIKGSKTVLSMIRGG